MSMKTRAKSQQRRGMLDDDKPPVLKPPGGFLHADKESSVNPKIHGEECRTQEVKLDVCPNR
jgi:hypothetical protein